MLRDRCGNDIETTPCGPTDRPSHAEARPNFTDWRPNTADSSERFRFGRTVWWVDAAKRILVAAPRASQLLTVADWRGMAGLLDSKSHPTSVDLSVPVICAQFGQGHLPIDGWSRIRRAIEAGIPTLPCV